MTHEQAMQEAERLWALYRSDDALRERVCASPEPFRALAYEGGHEALDGSVDWLIPMDAIEEIDAI